jgi:Tol biopolymer transport system component
LDVERDAASRLTDAGGNAQNYPVWSPDGQTIVFNTSLAHHSLFFKDVGGAGEDQPTIESPGLRIPFDWSRDGRFILYAGVAPGCAKTVSKCEPEAPKRVLL